MIYKKYEVPPDNAPEHYIGIIEPKEFNETYESVGETYVISFDHYMDLTDVKYVGMLPSNKFEETTTYFFATNNTSKFSSLKVEIQHTSDYRFDENFMKEFLKNNFSEYMI